MVPFINISEIQDINLHQEGSISTLYRRQTFLKFLWSCSGSRYCYTTHGWTLVSAVVESASGKSYVDYIRDSVLTPLAMHKTAPELNQPITYDRARLV